jgi:GT2 family glycosyltransferase/glycosyltransferase involved in cell wall biosynthesis/2-polyprenyl-3-methyl-5-hydroxy-6-metoxy-1,4-benzoquinol methylase
MTESKRCAATGGNVTAEALSHEISTLMQWPYEDVLRRIQAEESNPGLAVREAWVARSPDTRQQIELFYQTTDAYIFDLMVESHRDVRVTWRAAISKTLEEHFAHVDRAPKILDYGGGVGTDAMFWARRGFDVDYYDLPGVTSSFAGARFRAKRVPVRSIRIPEACYDAIVSLEVMEHLVDPLEHTRRIAQHLRPGGLYLFSEAFSLTGDDYPSHLVRAEDMGAMVADELARQGFRERELLLGRIHVYEYLPQVTVLVPVFNAYDHVRALLDSISALEDAAFTDWLFINDGSTDPRILPLLREFVTTHAFARLLHRESNSGFIATCNEGMSAVSGDVVLLNSDTIVYPNWLVQLTRAVYAAPDIGTATPLSNNASIYSVFREVHPANALWQYLAQVRMRPIDIPTGVGFCLYIRRAVIDAVGMFDPIFGVGYGEETDFCLRASRAGWRHVLAPGTFIHHAGSASMVAAGVVQKGETTRHESERILIRRFPEFAGKVDAFYDSRVMNKLIDTLEPGYVVWLTQHRKTIAVLLHHPLWEETIGGTEYHVRDLIAHYGGTYVFFVVAPAGSGYSVEVFADGHISRFETSGSLGAVLTALNPDVVHVHHLRGYSSLDVDALTRWHSSIVVTVHDFQMVCPQYTLLSHRGAYCGVPEDEACSHCAQQLFNLEFKDIVHHRGLHQQLLDRADVVIFPSEAAHDVLRLGLEVEDAKVLIVPHPYGAQPTSPIPTGAVIPRKRGLRVGFLGYSDKHKGADIQTAICSALDGSPVEFVFLGSIGVSKGNRTYAGLYKREDVVRLLHEYEIDVVGLTSNWPETFGFTVSEAWAAGVPVIAPPFGGPAERIGKHGGGWVLPRYDLRAYEDMLRALVADPASITKARESIQREMWSPPWSAYDTIYAALTEKASPSRGSVALTDWRLREATSPVASALTVSPLVRRAWQWRARLFPAGSTRERLYMAARRRTLGY